MSTVPSTLAGRFLMAGLMQNCGWPEDAARNGVMDIEAEAVAALTAERDRLREAAEAFVAAFEEQRHWGVDAEFPSDKYQALRAALAPGTPVDVE